MGYCYPLELNAGVDMIFQGRESGFEWDRYGEGLHLGFDYGQNGYLAEVGAGMAWAYYEEFGASLDLQYMYIEDLDSAYLGLGATGHLTFYMVKLGVFGLIDGETDEKVVFSIGLGFTY